MDTQKIAIDLGNGNVKAAAIRITTTTVEGLKAMKLGDVHQVNELSDGAKVVRELVVTSLPSKVGVGTTGMGALSLGGFEKKDKDDKPLQIESNDGAYLVGHGVERYASLLERFDAGKYSDSPELRALTRAVLAEIVDGGTHEVCLCVGLPVDTLLSENAKDTIKDLNGWLLTDHLFKVNGIEARVNVCATKPLAQPVGAFFAWGLDLAGEWVRDESDLTDATIAVLDSGFNTLDLLVVSQGRIVKRETGGDNLGVRVAAQEIANALKARYGVAKSLIEIDSYIRKYLDGGKVYQIFSGERVDLTPIVKQALQSLATKTVGYVESKWGNANEFSYVLLTGGGALAIEHEIKRHIPKSATLPDPVHANAIGLAKLAQRRGTFKGF